MPLTTIKFGEVPFTEAIDALRSMLSLTESDFYALSEVAKQRAFSFTGAYSDSAANAVQKVLIDTLAGRIGRDEFLARANAALDAFGIDLSAFQAETIFETTLAKAFGQGKDAQYANPIFRADNPYVGWVSAHDVRVRPNHFALDFRRINGVFRQDDFLWSVFHEPLGFRCRCTRIAFSQSEVQARGLQVFDGRDWYGKTVEVAVPGHGSVITRALPDPGFNSAGLTARALRYAAVIVAMFAGSARRLIAGRTDQPRDERGRWVAELHDQAVGSNVKTGIDVGPVSDVAARLAKASGAPDVTGYTHRIEADAIRHAQNRHPELTRADFERLPQVWDQPDTVTEGARDFEMRTVVYRKQMGDTLYVVHQVRAGKQRLAFKTMYKTKAQVPHA